LSFDGVISLSEERGIDDAEHRVPVVE